MRYVTFSTGGSARRPGVIEGESIRPFAEALARLEDFIAMDASGRKAALGALGPAVPLASAHLHAPVTPRKNIFCVGRNYLAHAEEGARVRGVELKLPDVPTFFSKAPTAVADPGQTLELMADVSSQYDWEAEMAIVIGKKCKNVSEADALDVIFGYTCLNDVTARDLQNKHVQWFKGKTLDNSCPIGPWIVDTGEIGDPQALDIALRVNGEVKQSANTAAMIFNLRRIIASLSHGLTLEPGDVIATGTPEGVGFARTPPEFLKDGDVMEVEVQNIGILRSPVRIGAPVGAVR